MSKTGTKTNPDWWRYPNPKTWEYPYLWPRAEEPINVRFAFNPKVELPDKREFDPKNAPEVSGWHAALAFRLYQHLVVDLVWLAPYIDLIWVGFKVSGGNHPHFSMDCAVNVVEPETERKWKFEGFCHLAVFEGKNWNNASAVDGPPDHIVQMCSYDISTVAIRELQSGMRTLDTKIKKMQAFHTIVESRDPIFPRMQR